MLLDVIGRECGIKECTRVTRVLHAYGSNYQVQYITDCIMGRSSRQLFDVLSSFWVGQPPNRENKDTVRNNNVTYDSFVDTTSPNLQEAEEKTRGGSERTRHIKSSTAAASC
jgi:hypothetical protein